MTNLTNVRREQLGSYTLSWPEGVFPLGSDALFLGNFATLRPGWRVCDLGTGSGALLLLLARRADAVVRVYCGLPQVLKGELPC